MHKLIKEIIKSSELENQLTAKGWLRTRRDSKGGFSFLELNDGSCFESLQVIAPDSLENYQTEILNLHPGSSLAVSGQLKKSPGGEQSIELHAEKIEVYGFSDIAEYPLQKKRISFEKLRELAHLRARTNTFGAVTRVRNCLSAATHRFFQERSFYYLNTPIITANDCEGAGEMFQVSTLDLSKIKGDVDYSHDFFKRRAGLTVSGQLSAETYACALGRVYTFGPTFRAENSHTSRHLSEFWMIEPEMAFADLDDDAQLATEYLKYLITALLNECPKDMEFFDNRIKKGIIGELSKLVDADFQKITYTEAVDILEKSNEKFEFDVSWGIDLQSEHERYLTEKKFNTPVIVTDYPKEIKAFYMRMNDDNKTVRAMDVLCPGIGEIIGGSQREERLDKLEERILSMGMDLADYWWYLDLRKYGTVPHAGFGLGFERMVQFCTGMENIRDVIPFPRTPGHAEF
ncbi:MAG: asparagine--tRNA ligase [Lentisphaeria bacterium]|nr:asparagine--tRNA ligase [Lentisphaeria bacterium]NQZ70834.1 asparagine--tRNA ligase [Lentisphaeria bacterium]